MYGCEFSVLLKTGRVFPNSWFVFISASSSQCTDAAVTIAAMMGSKSPFVSPFGSRDLADRKKAEMALGTSDHITMWNAYNKVCID